ncbi:hypothetical protein BJY01DRAFT_214383 [Aspergillus pseudoustus]|uniref:Uncharacterized protein n=1 Tax=Aspergillus pseudoustus TaxID=1810923 RepID=A0ABR4JZ12_9EURO
MSITVVADLAFTTPYVQPNSCWDLVGGSRGRTVTDGTTYYKEATDLYTECLPPSWRTIPPESRYSASPAVCPVGWRYWNIATSEVSSQLVTTAWCCDYYKDLYPSNDYPLDGYSKPCVQVEDDDYVHIPWHITWQESDVPNLSYQPPSVDPGMIIPTWLPGIIGAGPPEQVPLPTEPPNEPSSTVMTPEDTPSPSPSPPVPSPTNPGSSSSTPSSSRTEDPASSSSSSTSSQSHEDSGPGGSSSTGRPDGPHESDGSLSSSSTEDATPTSTDEPSVPQESPTFTSGASVHQSVMILPGIAKLAGGLGLCVGLSVLFGW